MTDGGSAAAFFNEGRNRSAHATSDALWDDTERGRCQPACDASHAATLVRHAPAGGGSRHQSCFRSCSATRAWRPPSATPTCPGRDVRRLPARVIRGPDARSKATEPTGSARPRPRPKGSRQSGGGGGRSGTVKSPRACEGGHGRRRGGEGRPGVADLWDEYKGAGRRRARASHPALRAAASSTWRAGCDGPARQRRTGRLVSYGMFGLIDALEKFEPARGNKFETYAIPRIKGRSSTSCARWMGAAVGALKAREIEKAYADLESKLKRAPGEGEVAERLGVSLPELHNVINQISFVSVLALDELLAVGTDRGEHVSLMDTLATAAWTQPRGSRARRREDSCRRRSTRCPNARRSSSPCTTSRAHAGRDRRDPRRHGVTRVPDPHEGRRPAPPAARRGGVTTGVTRFTADRPRVG